MNFIEKLLNLFKKPSAQTSDSKIIAAKVTAIEKHPNADRLRVVTLSDGTNTYSPIVCGAFNFNEGDVVALALPGAEIAHNIHSVAHEPFTLGTATIRGVESQGMICAGFELGKSTEIETGILILDPTTKLGSAI